MCGCDVDAPSCYREEERTARLAHRCCECTGEIKPGDRYQYASGVWDGAPSSFKTCLLCVAAKKGYVAQLHWSDCGVCFTQLYDDWPVEELPDHVKALRKAA
jgi:hypothetical protein